MQRIKKIIKAVGGKPKAKAGNRKRSIHNHVATRPRIIKPTEGMLEIKIPDATPGIIFKYALRGEQALLATIRYNRLIDIFSEVTCYSLQCNLRSTLPKMGKLEVDEIDVGIDRHGAHYVFPVQASRSLFKIEQAFAICAKKFPTLICIPIAAQFVALDAVALFGFTKSSSGVGVTSEKHYQLVPFNFFE